MESNDINVKSKLNELRREAGFFRIDRCSGEESARYYQLLKRGEQLPQNIRNLSATEYPEFYKKVECGLTDEEKGEYIALKQAREVTTIKKCLVFFTVLTIISLVSSLVSVIVLASKLF